MIGCAQTIVSCSWKSFWTRKLCEKNRRLWTMQSHSIGSENQLLPNWLVIGPGQSQRDFVIFVFFFFFPCKVRRCVCVCDWKRWKVKIAFQRRSKKKKNPPADLSRQRDIDVRAYLKLSITGLPNLRNSFFRTRIDFDWPHCLNLSNLINRVIYVLEL